MSKEVKDIKDLFSKEDGSKIGYWSKEGNKDVLISTMPDAVTSIKVYEIDENGKRVLVETN